MKITSSIIVSHGAQGIGQLFTHALGAPVPQMGDDPNFTPRARFDHRLTNLVQAGVLGTIFGNQLLRGVSVDYLIGSAEDIKTVAENCEFVLKVGSSKHVFASVLSALPQKVEPFFAVDRTQTIRGELQAPLEGLALKAPVIVRISLDTFSDVEGDGEGDLQHMKICTSCKGDGYIFRK